MGNNYAKTASSMYRVRKKHEKELATMLKKGGFFCPKNRVFQIKIMFPKKFGNWTLCFVGVACTLRGQSTAAECTSDVTEWW